MSGLLVSAPLVRADILFQGVITAGALQQFALQDTGAGVSKWCKPGETFGHLTILGYDEPKETLNCRDAGGANVALLLNVSVVRALRATAPAGRFAQVFLSDELREQLRAQGKGEADVFNTTLQSLQAELEKRQSNDERAQILALIDGFKAGRVKVYDTGGRPLRYEDVPEMKKEAVDRINQLMGMTEEEVRALIEKRKAAKQSPVPAEPKH